MLDPHLDLMRTVETYHAHMSIQNKLDYNLIFDYLIYKNSAEKYLHMY
jgi:hypothetical protein